MRKKLLTGTFSLLLASSVFLVFFAGAVMAAEGDNYDQPPPRGQMEKIREKINTLRMWQLTRALNLDENTAARLFPILNGFDKKRAGLEYGQRISMRDLRDAVQGGDEARMKAVMDKLEASHQALERLNSAERAQVKRVLTVQQQAKFLLFQHEFNRRLRKMIAQARQEKRLQGGNKEDFKW
ncbi:MAG: hypothetical protein M0Z59_02875 [Nitrospiraceae bacterium]|nr:hypothetical protein [Nitrospiraceae bacterium]